MQLTLFGFPTYFISRAEDITEVYRNTRTLTLDEFYQRVFLDMGTSKQGVSKLFESAPKDVKHAETKREKSAVQVLRELQILQLQPGPHLDALELAVLSYMDRHMQPGVLRTSDSRYQDERGRRGPSNGADSFELPLLHWCSDIMIRSAQMTLFGSAVDRIDPCLPDRFLEFENLSWKMLYQFPEFLARDFINKRDYLRGVLKTFCDLPQKERSDAEAWVISSTEEKCRNLGISSDDTASVLLVLYWG